MRLNQGSAYPVIRSNQKVAVYGAGGHARVVLDSLIDQGANIVGLLKDDLEGSRTVFGIPILGDRTMLPELFRHGVRAIHIAIGNNRTRRQIAELCLGMGFDLLTVSHRTATIGREARIGAGCFIAANAVIGPNAFLGAACIINHGSTIDHDCVLGDAVHIAPGTHLAGHVSVGDESVIGVGSAVRDRISIGFRTIIGAGSVVVTDIPDCAIAYGTPARKMGESDGASRKSHD